MKTDIFNIEIPDELIAQYPSEIRSESRLLVYNRKTDLIIDSYTKNIADFLDDSYFLVFNNSKVMPARIKIVKESNHREGEALILKIIDDKTAEVLTDKSRKYPVGTKIIFPENIKVQVVENLEDSVKLVKSEKAIFNIDYLEKNGHVPLPPYIRDAKDEDYDKARYQTVYSKLYGSAAAPTAGLHFDDNIFNSLKTKKIDHTFVSLHVGLGTFQPIYSDNIEDHKIHREDYYIDPENADKINEALKSDKKIIPVGTTSLRTLETAYSNGIIPDGNGFSELYIYPGYDFKIASGLFTNFHTPKSTLLVLVSSLLGSVDKLKELYSHAVDNKYRFFSYGDAMLIL